MTLIYYHFPLENVIFATLWFLQHYGLRLEHIVNNFFLLTVDYLHYCKNVSGDTGSKRNFTYFTTEIFGIFLNREILIGK